MNIPRRDLLSGAAAAFTTSLFTGRVRGANDRVAVGFIGLGAMGSGNLGYAMKVPEAQPVALCDVYQPHLERAEAAARKGGFTPKSVKDFRDILADKSIDAVCISTPDHWHAYMTVEACKAGKDVYVEKPSCVYVDEGQKMVEAARKYKRVVQAGTMQRSGGYFRKAAEIVQSGALGEITMCHAFQSGLTKTRRLRQSAGQRGARRTRLGYVARARAQGAVQRQPLGRREGDVPHLPLLLGLRRRRHDRLGRPPHRPDPPVLRRAHAAGGQRHGRQVLRAGQRARRRTRWKRSSSTRSSSPPTRAAPPIRCPCSIPATARRSTAPKAASCVTPQQLHGDSRRQDQQAHRRHV